MRLIGSFFGSFSNRIMTKTLAREIPRSEDIIGIEQLDPGAPAGASTFHFNATVEPSRGPLLHYYLRMSPFFYFSKEGSFV